LDEGAAGAFGKKMVMTASENQMGPSTGMDRAGPLVAFDFDGTLTVRDSFIAFLRWRSGATGYYVKMARLASAAAAYMNDHDRTRLKSAAVKVFLKGVPRATLEAQATEFAAIAAPRLLRPDALKVWRRHRAEGARVMIVTASPEPVVAPFARGLGADLLIGSRLLYDAHDRVGPGLDGLNCRGPEKERRLREVIGPDARLAAAYGDTDGDREMLAMADEGFMKLFTGVPTITVGAP
jgi:phosphatidylglycerophosphatase C